MKKLIQSLLLVVFMALPFMAQAQQQVTIRELNTYDVPLTSEDDIPNHPLVGVDVTFTAVVASNPTSSGLATFNDDGSIGRVHVFVIDTTALNDPNGRAGMAIQIVESELALVENLLRGGVYEFRGDLGNFGNTMQFDLSEAPVEIGNVNTDLTQFAPLLEPWTITLDELNENNGNGTFNINLDNYTTYNGQYVKIEGANVIVQELGDRPNWAIDKESRVWIYDTGLRLRNDWLDNYRAGYNFRRSEANGGKGEFVPPPPGSIADVSGFVVLNDDNPAGDNAPDRETFNINPFEDGTFWSADSTRFDDGDDIGGGQTFEWPNDITVVGSPPLVTNLGTTPDSAVIASSTEVVVSADVAAQQTGEVIDSVKVFFTATGQSEQSLEMTNTVGDTYEATLPTFANLTAVSYRIEAYQSDGLVANFPFVGSQSFFVSDDELNSIDLIQRTADDSTGASPLAGAGQLPVNITATVVNDAANGPIVIHESSNAFGGVFLERTNETEALVVGDEITITSASVEDVVVDDFGISDASLTILTNLTFTVNSQGNDVSGLIPSLITDDVIALEKEGEVEPWEGMLIQFDNVAFVEEGGFGEFTVASTAGGGTPADGIIINEDLRSADVGFTDFPGDLNIHLREGIEFTSVTGVMTSAFGNPTLNPRSLADLTIGGNWTFPVLDFDLIAPDDSAEVIVDGDISVDWDDTFDYDGEDVTYEWVLYAAADTSEIVAVSAGSATEVLLTFETVDGLLESAGLNVGDTADFLWNVRVSDGNDTLEVASEYDFDALEYITAYRFLTLERAEATSNEDGELGLPKVFSLDQNYPNPFNPSTNINFALPQAAKVSLTIYDMLGRKVATLLNEQRPAGRHTVQFDASSLASGMYIYRIEAASFTSTKKMLLIK